MVIWKEYIAPNGKKYYYNKVTKQTTWVKPVHFGNATKKGRIMANDIQDDKIVKPIFVIPLAYDYKLVICNNGSKFYINDKGKSINNLQINKNDVLDDIGIHNLQINQQLIDLVDKEKLIKLIGVARGYSHMNTEKKHDNDEKNGSIKHVINYHKIYNDICIEVESLFEEIDANEKYQQEQKRREEKKVDEIEGTVVDEEIEIQNENPVTKIPVDENKSINLLNQYYSDSDSDDQDELAQKRATENESINDEETVTKKQKIVEDDKIQTNDFSNEIKHKYFKLFDDYDLDKYSLWAIEKKKIENDDNFYLLMDDNQLEEIFEEWCSSMTRDSDREEEICDDELEETASLEPLPCHYLSQIISKSTINSDAIPQDIKAANKKLFKSYRIKDYLPEKSEQLKAIGQIIYYYKTFDSVERKAKFQQLLTENTDRLDLQDVDLLKRKYQKQLQNVRAHSQKGTDDDNYVNFFDSATELETFILECEKKLNVSGLPLATDPRYFMLGLGDKCIEWCKWLLDR